MISKNAVWSLRLGPMYCLHHKCPMTIYGGCPECNKQLLEEYKMKLRNKKTGENEPKEYWYIVSMCAGLQKKKDTDNGEDSFNKEIGNCFGSLEEAEKAVEKLKAWKRLQDKGFRFVEHQIHGMTEDGEGDGCAYFEFDKPLDKSDLDLLFGGEG